MFNQSYRPLDVIVIDDGSTDNTVAAVRNWMELFSDANFTVRLISQENMGGNHARNRGIAESTGKFIAFLDSDDLWFPDKLEKQIERFDALNVGGVYCGVQHVDESLSQITASYNRKYPVGWILDQILVRDVTAPTSAFVLRREVFDTVGGFDVELQARQDWDMWIRLASAYKVQAVPELLVEYREHSGLRTASNPMREIDAYKAIRKKYAELLKQQPPHVQRAAKASFYKRMGRVYFHHKISAAKALQFYAVAILNKPNDFDTWAAIGGVFLPTKLRQWLHRLWNEIFGDTSLAIRSH